MYKYKPNKTVRDHPVYKQNYGKSNGIGINIKPLCCIYDAIFCHSKVMFIGLNALFILPLYIL